MYHIDNLAWAIKKIDVPIFLIFLADIGDMICSPLKRKQINFLWEEIISSCIRLKLPFIGLCLGDGIQCSHQHSFLWQMRWSLSCSCIIKRSLLEGRDQCQSRTPWTLSFWTRDIKLLPAGWTQRFISNVLLAAQLWLLLAYCPGLFSRCSGRVGQVQ